MFEKTYIFKGKHADYVKELVEEAQLFKRYIDVLIIAPIIGFLYGERKKEDSSNKNAKIFAEQIIKENDKLKFIFRLIMLLDNDEIKEVEDRINLTFNMNETESYSEKEEIFNSYIRGGVEVLHNNIFFEPGSDGKVLQREKDAYVDKMFSFIKDFKKDLETREDEEDIEELINRYETI